MKPKETHAQLIVGKTPEERKEKILEITGLKEISRKPDIHILKLEEDQTSIGIDAVRELTHALSRKPHQRKKKLALILEAQFLTEEAQNALLKTLEEPPGETQILLSVKSTRSLLPTIISRCELIPLRGEDQKHPVPEEIKKEFLDLLQKSAGARLEWGEEKKEEISSRKEAEKLLAAWILILRSFLFKEKTALRTKKHLKLGLKYLNLLQKTNVSPRLIIENFLLSLPVKKVGGNPRICP